MSASSPRSGSRSSGRTLGSIGLLLGLSACTSPVPRPNASATRAARERWPGTTRVQLENGRSLFLARCSGCHNLPKPTDYSAQEWRPIVERMEPLAKLTNEQGELVLRYVVAIRESGPTGE